MRLVFAVYRKEEFYNKEMQGCNFKFKDVISSICCVAAKPIQIMAIKILNRSKSKVQI